MTIRRDWRFNATSGRGFMGRDRRGRLCLGIQSVVGTGSPAGDLAASRLRGGFSLGFLPKGSSEEDRFAGPASADVDFSAGGSNLRHARGGPSGESGDQGGLGLTGRGIAPPGCLSRPKRPGGSWRSFQPMYHRHNVRCISSPDMLDSLSRCSGVNSRSKNRPSSSSVARLRGSPVCRAAYWWSMNDVKSPDTCRRCSSGARD